MLIVISNLTTTALPFLEEMLFEAFFWNPEMTRPAFSEFRNDPIFRSLLADWGRKGDVAIIAETGGQKVGAAWYRLWAKENHSYGFVDEETPEIGLGVASEFRGQGIGRKLMEALIEEASQAGYPALSLSADPNNFALKLYQSLRFTKVGESGTSWTLLRLL